MLASDCVKKLICFGSLLVQSPHLNRLVNLQSVIIVPLEFAFTLESFVFFVTEEVFLH